MTCVNDELAARPALQRGLFISAEDFDITGLFPGLEPCASSYWWLPDLQEMPANHLAPTGGSVAVAAEHDPSGQARRPGRKNARRAA
jgi:hypothetical protein